MGIALAWNDARRMLGLKLHPGSRTLSPLPRTIDVQLLGEKNTISRESQSRFPSLKNLTSVHFLRLLAREKSRFVARRARKKLRAPIRDWRPLKSLTLTTYQGR